MTGVGVIDIYDTIKRSNGEYCGICFQTASERKLVNPVFLRHFQEAMESENVKKMSRKTEMKACYMCEALAGSAVRFLWAYQLAAVIEKLCAHIETHSSRDVVLNHINGTNKIASSIFCLQAKACEDSLHRLPRSLYRTETLVVSSDSTRYSFQPTQVPAASPAAQTDQQSTKNTRTKNQHQVQKHSAHALPAKATVAQDINELAADIPESVLNVLQNLGEVVVVEDQSAPPDASRALALQTRSPDQSALHLIVKGVDGNTYVPSLKIQVCDGVVKSVSDRHLFTYTNTPIPDRKSQKKRSNSPVFVISKDFFRFGDYNDFLQKQNTTKNIEHCHEINRNSNAVLNHEGTTEAAKKKRTDCPVILNPHVNPYGSFQLTNPIKELILLIDDPADNITNESSGDTSKSNKMGDAKIRKTNVTNKRPLPSTDILDWEDKIPMDVISFMDATDPNPSERIMQPNPPRSCLGVISDVRTVEESDVQIIDDVECIDLC